MNNKSLKIYLCGGIAGLSDQECKGWREKAKEILSNNEYLSKVEFLDPMVRDYRGNESGNSGIIVQEDLKDIVSCDIILANVSRPSWGTAMELVYARILKKEVFAFDENWEADKVYSPWILEHIDGHVFESLQMACTVIEYCFEDFNF